VYQVLRKDTVELEIVPYLPETKRGFEPKRSLYEIVNAVLYKLKTRVRCEITLQKCFCHSACSETK
jgi:hypothetical protein